MYLFFSPFNLSVVFSARTIGPTLGYTLASACLSIYVDPGNIPPGIDEDHPRYIGAWWIGFIVIAVLLMIFAPWLTLFPSVLPSKVSCLFHFVVFLHIILNYIPYINRYVCTDFELLLYL